MGKRDDGQPKAGQPVEPLRSVRRIGRGAGARRWAAKPSPAQAAAEQAAAESAWRAYNTAGEATRAAVDLVLLPKGERDALEKQARLSIEILEERAAQLLNERKKTKAA